MGEESCRALVNGLTPAIRSLLPSMSLKWLTSLTNWEPWGHRLRTNNQVLTLEIADRHIHKAPLSLSVDDALVPLLKHLQLREMNLLGLPPDKVKMHRIAAWCAWHQR